MEKIIAGKIILYREECPECGEWNISGNKKFECTWCSLIYENQNNIKLRQLTNSRFKRLIFTRKQKEIIWQRQRGRCYWCYRKFNIWYMKRNNTRMLKMHMDHKMPYSYLPDNNLKNICGACSICNLFKSNKIFDSDRDCMEYLLEKWEKALRNKSIVLLDESFD